MVILSDGLVMMVNRPVDLPLIQTRSLEPGGVMDTKNMSINGLKLKAAISERPVGRKQLQLMRLQPMRQPLMRPQPMRPPLMTIQQSRLTHRKENLVTIQAYNVLKAWLAPQSLTLEPMVRPTHALQL